MKNLFNIYTWAVAEFLEIYGFFPNEDEKAPGFVNRAGDVEFLFEIVKTDSDQSVTEAVGEIVNKYFPFDVRSTAMEDWRLLFERFKLLDGDEDSGKKENEIPEQGKSEWGWQSNRAHYAGMASMY